MYKVALKGGQKDEEALFHVLAERLRLFVEQRVENRSACEDIVQNSLATIAGKYRTTEFTSSFAAWVYGVLHKKLQHYYRAKRQYHERFEDLSTPEVSTADPALQATLLACLRELCRRSTSQARALNLTFHGFSISEACARLGLTPNAYYIQLSRARSYLRACLKRKKVSL